jgi:hypothetical protein
MIFSGSHGCAVTPNGTGKVPPIRVVCQVVSFGFETLRKYREPHRIFDNLAVAQLSRRRIVFTLARVRCGVREFIFERRAEPRPAQRQSHQGPRGSLLEAEVGEDRSQPDRLPRTAQ